MKEREREYDRLLTERKEMKHDEKKGGKVTNKLSWMYFFFAVEKKAFSLISGFRIVCQ